ncbi:uncharacterized protein LOC132269333 isoform X2 [Cornus florida]|uniref:uncharacterized protein LOC132269333 isoform X2 n=1 Tax=Cornus florida TaxID=4283 RepID=UPI00289A9208|nr:uncharacterized protein LOC132269333 isoform X2 [Cornus florida]
MDDVGVSLYLVASFGGGPYCAAIYEIKFVVVGGEIGSKIARVCPLQKAFRCLDEERIYSPVGCDYTGLKMVLMASYWDLHDKFFQFKPICFNTITKKGFELPLPEAEKPYPLVMVDPDYGFFVLAGATLYSSYKIRSPCFERLDPLDGWHDSDYNDCSLPEYPLDKKLPRIISGYAVIQYCILISVHDFLHGNSEFYYYRIGSEMKNWQVIKKEKENGLYYPIFGKAEYVDGYLYTFCCNYNLIAYQVVENDGIIQSIGVPVYFRGLDFKDLPVDCDPAFSGCFVHLGNKRFCMMKTGINVDPSNFQYVSILIVQVSDDMHLSTTWSGLCALNIENLAPANLTSLFLDSQQSRYAYKSEFWTSGPIVWAEEFEDLDVDTLMQPVNTDPPKPESVPEVQSVDGFLQKLGLENYSTMFEYEDMDMATFGRLTVDDFEDLGLPEGPRKTILLALETENSSLSLSNTKIAPINNEVD